MCVRLVILGQCVPIDEMTWRRGGLFRSTQEVERFDTARLLIEWFRNAISAQREAYAFGLSDRTPIGRATTRPRKTLRTTCEIPAFIEAKRCDVGFNWASAIAALPH
jgi:hypothetical protein